MKTKRAVVVAGAVLVWAAGFFFNSFSLHAQVQSIGTAAPLAEPIVQAPPDSVVKIVADAQGLPLVAPEQLPRYGTFWRVESPPSFGRGIRLLMILPWPCPPDDPTLPVYCIGANQFLVDATAGELMQQGTQRRLLDDATATATLAAQVEQVLDVVNLVQDAQINAEMNAMLGLSNELSPAGADAPGAVNYGTNLWLLLTTNVLGTPNQFAAILTNTIAGQPYDILTKQALTDPDWFVEYASLYAQTNFIPFQLAMAGRTNLFVWARFAGDSTGSGLPDWWQYKYFGAVGVDPYAQDSSGDGWNYLQDYNNGFIPGTFNTPPAPQGYSVSYNKLSGKVTGHWQPASGNVAGYTITRTDPNTWTQQQFNFGTTTTSFVDNSPITVFPPERGEPTYTLQANYAQGNSATKTLSMFDPNTTVSAALVRGMAGKTDLLLNSPIPVGTTTLHFILTYFNANWDYVNDTYDLPASSVTNGSAVMPDAWINNWVNAAMNVGDPEWFVQTIASDGDVSDLTYLEDQEPWVASIPFNDGRQELKQNLNFLLTVANSWGPFELRVANTSYLYRYPTNYVYSGLFEPHDTYFNSSSYSLLDEFMPYRENYLYRNFVFSPSDLNPDGSLNTGVQLTVYSGNDGVSVSEPPAYNLEQTNALTALLPEPAALWTAFFPQAAGLDAWYTFHALPAININHAAGMYYMTNTAAFTTISGDVQGPLNFFGLPYLSAKFAYDNSGTLQYSTLYFGGSVPEVSGGVYQQTAAPQLQTVGYYFAQPGINPLPGESAFATSNTTPAGLFAGCGQTTLIAGYAKQRLLNGYSNVFGYLGQYFEQAYQIATNGVVTTNSAGTVSPYGEFFATVPGPAALVTMTNWGVNERGTSVVQVVSLAIDGNHDGTIDASLTGADQTSAAHPYKFWVNNNYDRSTLDQDDAAYYDDDVSSTSPDAKSLFTGNYAPDFDFRDAAGNRVISCTRDLQDFARLWICGLDTNLVASLPPGSTITLSWGDVRYPNPGNPTIDLFQAADPDGGIGYLTNSTTAVIQTLALAYPCLGRLGPGQSIQLNASAFANHWAGNHFIWCGVTNGSGTLTLSIVDANTNTLAQTSAYIQIQDIKDMYERWTVGERPAYAPTNTALLAENDLPVGETSGFQYSYNSLTDSNTPYILYVHGWNMETWDKDRFAESAFKRLYWQGYQGRFGVFRWPTDSGFTGGWTALTDPRNYDNSEYQAWQSATGLLNKLNNLNAQYPGQVYMLAHSMGNVVAGEALRLAGNNQVVNTYVASQAAVPAHNYDATITTPYLLQFTYTYPNEPLHTLLGNRNYGPDTPNIYGNRLTNNAAAGRRVNFYNQNDFALAAPRWCFDEITKPDYIPPNNYYYYSGPVTDATPWNKFKDSPIVGGTGVLVDIVTNLNNLYKIMSYAAESYSTALGATPGITNLFNLDLTRSAPTRIWPLDSSGHNYTDHFWHSAEFRGDCWQEWGYWHTLVFSPQFGFNIQNP